MKKILLLFVFTFMLNGCVVDVVETGVPCHSYDVIERNDGYGPSYLVKVPCTHLCYYNY